MDNCCSKCHVPVPASLHEIACSVFLVRASDVVRQLAWKVTTWGVWCLHSSIDELDARHCYMGC